MIVSEMSVESMIFL